MVSFRYHLWYNSSKESEKGFLDATGENFIAPNKAEIATLISYFMRTKYGNVAVGFFILRKIQASTRLKDLNVPIANKYN